MDGDSFTIKYRAFDWTLNKTFRSQPPVPPSRPERPSPSSNKLQAPPPLPPGPPPGQGLPTPRLVRIRRQVGRCTREGLWAGNEAQRE